MSLDTQDLVYVKPEERIYDIATNKDLINWKSFLYELIYNEGLDPWDIDLSILTKKYIASLKELSSVDFDVSGNFLTIAVFLLKTKTQRLLEKDIRGIEESIANISSGENVIEELQALENLDIHLEELETQKRKEKYSLKYRNPIARKRKVTIFDLIKTLEKTFEQSNRRRANFFQRQGSGIYDGPMYHKKPKDLKQLIEELYELILGELSSKSGKMTFDSLIHGISDKMTVLEKFIPLLHLHNNNRVKLMQNEHFGDINIHGVLQDED